MNYTIIVLVFVILFMLCVGYLYFTSQVLTSGVVSLTAAPASVSPILWTSITQPASPVYHYEGWLFITQLPTVGSYDVIFSRQGTSNTQIALVIDSSAELLIVSDSSVATNGVFSSLGNSILLYNQFPLQKWVYFVINVNGSILEAYLNGKLVYTGFTQTTSGNPLYLQNQNPQYNIYVGATTGGDSNFVGYITKFLYSPTVLLPDNVWKNYTSGNGLATLSSWLNGYNVGFSIYDSAQMVKQYTLF